MAAADKIHFSCPECGAALIASQDKAGGRLACPKCKRAVEVPSFTRMREPSVSPPPPLSEKKPRPKLDPSIFDDLPHAEIDFPTEEETGDSP